MTSSRPRGLIVFLFLLARGCEYQRQHPEEPSLRCRRTRSGRLPGYGFSRNLILTQGSCRGLVFHVIFYGPGSVLPLTTWYRGSCLLAVGCVRDLFSGSAGTEQREVRAASWHHESSRHPRVQVLRHGAAAAPGGKGWLGEWRGGGRRHALDITSLFFSCAPGKESMGILTPRSLRGTVRPSYGLASPSRNVTI